MTEESWARGDAAVQQRNGAGNLILIDSASEDGRPLLTRDLTNTLAEPPLCTQACRHPLLLLTVTFLISY